MDLHFFFPFCQAWANAYINRILKSVVNYESDLIIILHWKDNGLHVCAAGVQVLPAYTKETLPSFKIWIAKKREMPKFKITACRFLCRIWRIENTCKNISRQRQEEQTVTKLVPVTNHNIYFKPSVCYSVKGRLPLF